MPGYIDKVLTKFQRSAPAIPQQTPYHVKPHRPFLPGHRQFVPTPDLAPKLDKSGITRLQSIIGSLLYYARALVYTLLPALNTIASSQSSPTERTMQKYHHLLDYVASHPCNIVRYCANDMIVSIDSDAAYLVAPKARSRIAVYFELNSLPHIINGALLVECKTLRQVVNSRHLSQCASDSSN